MVRESRVGGRKVRSRWATASTRRACPAISSLARRMRVRWAPVSGPLGPAVHRSSSTSGAPFTYTRKPPSALGWMVDMSLREESKGSSSRRGWASSSLFLSSPSLAAATTRAPSVGSPWAAGAPARHSSRASLHRQPAVRASRRRPPAGTQSCCTVIRFWVRVPVLSEQITPAHPKVSTAGSFFTMAPRWAIRPTPRARTMVTMAGSPSGMAATARETAVRNMSSRSFPWMSPTPNITAHTHRHRKDRVLEISPIRRWRGVSVPPLSSSRPAICPIWVSIPVAHTRAVPRPAVIRVPEMTMLVQSPRGASSGRDSQGAFSTGTDSPVMGDSSAWRRLHARIRASAGTRSPASSRITSPGTSWAAGILVTFPPRRAEAWGEESFRSSSRACWARSSWEMERMPFTTTMTRMMTASSQSSPPLAARDTPAAPSSTRIMGSRSCSNTRPRSPACLGGSSSLGPKRRSRSSAWRGVSPPGLASSSSKSRAAGLLCQLLMVSRSFRFLPFYQRACPHFGENRGAAAFLQAKARRFRGGPLR